MSEIIAAIREAGLAIGHKKTRHAGPGHAHTVTGYTVNGPHGPKVMRSKVQEIRTDVYKAVCAVREAHDIAVAPLIGVRPTHWLGGNAANSDEGRDR